MNTTELEIFKSQTMSSIEIAKLTGKNHDHVLRDIRVQLFTGLYNIEFDNPKMVYPLIQGLTVITDNHTKRTKEILLDHEHTLTLMTGYDVKARHKINKRWIELEAAQPKVPTNYLEALVALVQSETEKQSLQNKIETEKPKVEFAETIRNTDGKVSVGDFAKVIGTSQNRLFERLRNDGFLMANNRPYQHSIDRELLVSIEQKPHVYNNGNPIQVLRRLLLAKDRFILKNVTEKMFCNN